MAIADNLLSTVQSYITPDFVNRSSRALGLQPDTTKAGLTAAIPTLLMGLIHKGSNPDGAQGLLSMIQKGGYASGPSGSFMDRLQESKSIDQVLRGGADATHGLFGNQSDTIGAALGTSTGIHSSSMTKIIGLASPLIMGALGHVVSKNGLNASSLSSFLSQQKPMISGLVPSGLSGLLGADKTAGMGEVVQRPVENLRGAQQQMSPDAHERQGSRTWLPIVLGALLLALAGTWFMKHRGSEVVQRPDERETVSGATQAAPEKTAPAGQVGDFLASGARGEVPKRFRFENLTFRSGSATITPQSKEELNQIATALKDHPSAKVRVEGFTDDTGPAAANKSLSDRRAATVKEQLVSLGIEADRISSAGFGEEKPIASNGSDDGRRQNRRTELVVLQK